MRMAPGKSKTKHSAEKRQPCREGWGKCRNHRKRLHARHTTCHPFSPGAQGHSSGREGFPGMASIPLTDGSQILASVPFW